MTDNQPTPATLKPCPFCGETPTLGNNGGAGGELWFQINCESQTCEVAPYAQAFGKPELAISDWNTRPLEEADRATIAEQAEEIERLEELILEAACVGDGQHVCVCGAGRPCREAAAILTRRAALSKREPGR